MGAPYRIRKLACPIPPHEQVALHHIDQRVFGPIFDQKVDEALFRKSLEGRQFFITESPSGELLACGAYGRLGDSPEELEAICGTLKILELLDKDPKQGDRFIAAHLDSLRARSNYKGPLSRKYPKKLKDFVSMIPQAEDVVLSSLAVLPGHRGQGIGTSLIRARMEAAQLQGARRAFVTCLDTNHIGIYQLLGFQEFFFAKPGLVSGHGCHEMVAVLNA